MNKPTFFISSTIYDFADLRSSIKWWLEENNYLVNASDFNDFDKPIDTNSYEACLKAIDNSDYFILIIGDRTGGMYDSNSTITQKEYQYAYSKMLKGEIKIINLIRRDTWTNFNDSKAKIKELKKRNKVDSTIASNFLNDDEKIRFKFIDEVRRVKEMKVGELPKNNWIHSFTTFSEIVDVLRIQLGGKLDLNYKQNRYIAIRDLKNNLKQICRKNEQDIYPIAFLAKALWDDFLFDFDNPNFTFTEKQYINYAHFYVSCMQIKPLRLNRLESLYKSGYFLEYDKDKDDFVNGKLNKIAISLISSYQKINDLHKSIYKEQSKRLIELGKKSNNSHLRGSRLEIFFALDFRDNIENCINLSKNLYNGLFGKPYEMPTIIQKNRLPEEMQAKPKDFINEKEITEYLDS
ncbi:DUF4062 domain-containing protein [Tenacibaculum maritimum]|uniref:DUF4062 domain-containing protein n=1 Tax=Tenacibaculum maritimum TaxID=107401 RepID=UPI00388DB887